MFDIDFYMKSYPLQQKLSRGEKIPKDEVIEYFENYRSKDPIVYNIETTNACNMRCKMCPRTTRMNRSIDFLDLGFYDKILSQLKPHSDELWSKWEKFCIETYDIKPDDDASENHFFLYIIPNIIQLHGYGDPLLDKNLGNVIKKLSNHGLHSYFSCNPANIDIERTLEMMGNGLDYLKYSFESTDDKEFKDIRGNAANFTEAYRKTLEVVNLKHKHGFKTKIIITMIDIDRENQKEEYDKLRNLFDNAGRVKDDFYTYLKSEDQQWYRKDESLEKYLEFRGREIPKKEFHGTKAIHWMETCKHPWMSITIKSDGKVAMCMEDYNNEIVLGNAYKDSLYDIWNGKAYEKFRNDHFNLTPCIKCTEECDMPKIGAYFQ